MGYLQDVISVIYQNTIPSVSHFDITDDYKLKNIKVQWPVVACCSYCVSLNL
jgi:hypothetical protein